MDNLIAQTENKIGSIKIPVEINIDNASLDKLKGKVSRIEFLTEELKKEISSLENITLEVSID